MNLLTTGKIATLLNVHRDQVNYAVRRLGIKEVGRAGPTKVLPDTALEEVKQFLTAIEQKKADNDRRDHRTN